MVALTSYIIVSAALLGIGVYGLSVKKNAMRLLFAIEIIVNAANLNFAAFTRYMSPPRYPDRLSYSTLSQLLPWRRRSV